MVCPSVKANDVERPGFRNNRGCVSNIAVLGFIADGNIIDSDAQTKPERGNGGYIKADVNGGV